MTNPLDGVLDWYNLVLDCLNVAQRVDRLRVDRVVTAKHPVLHRLPAGDREPVVEEAKEALERLAVIDLVAVFERTVRSHLTGVLSAALPGGPPFGDVLRTRFEADLELWRFKDQLVDAFGAVDAGVRRRVKDVYDFRNWAAHGWYVQKPAPQRFRPPDARDHLTAFLKAAGIVT